MHITEWVERVAFLIGPKGILRSDEAPDWAEWIVHVAEFLRGVDWKMDDGTDMEHRWPFEIVESLVPIPADAISRSVRERSLALLSAAHEHYSSKPLADTFVIQIAEVEASLRKHFGETDTHPRMIRRQYEALLRAARFHGEKGSALGAQHFFREARKLVEVQRNYFTEADVDELQRMEREALQAANEGGEFKEVRAGEVEINLDNFDLRQGTAEETVRFLLTLRGDRIPVYEKIQEDAKRIMREHPIQFLFGASTIDRGKVVSEARTEEQHLRRVVQQQMSFHAQFIGLELHVTLARAFQDGLLTAADVVKELGLLGLDDEEMAILERGIERFLAEDYISAGHILSSQFENAFRRKLTQVGIEPTRFRTFPDGTTRTDEAALGDLMHSSTPDGRSVREIIGEDGWQFIDRTMIAVDGWNLRNKFAHGLVGRAECVGPVVGIILHHIFWLATLEAVPVASDVNPLGEPRGSEAHT